MTDTPQHRFEPGLIGWQTYDARGRRVRARKTFRGVDRHAFHFRAINHWINARVRDRTYQDAPSNAKRFAASCMNVWLIAPLIVLVGAKF